MIEKELSLPGGRRLLLGRRTLVMGILNVTPDSFYPGSRSRDVSAVTEAAERMVADGVDILDIGGESTRPGSDYVTEAEEIDRVVPAVRSVRRRLGVPISVDTRKAAVARAVLDEGADMINDVSALRDDPLLAGLAAERRCPVILMHMRGNPRTMQVDPAYADTVAEIVSELRERAEAARASGIADECILLDPGIGFGKRTEDNLLILR
ncbi:dihydropteroate synthase, partial [Salinispira pacifica]